MIEVIGVILVVILYMVVRLWLLLRGDADASD